MRLDNTRLLVTDFPACYRFYRDIIGLAVNFGKEHDSYASFSTTVGDPSAGAYLALFGRSMLAEAIGTSDRPATTIAQDTMMLVFEVEDVDTTVAHLRSLGVDFVAPLTDRPEWGQRTAHLRDPDGNLIEIYHSIPMAH